MTPNTHRRTRNKRFVSSTNKTLPAALISIFIASIFTGYNIYHLHVNTPSSNKSIGTANHLAVRINNVSSSAFEQPIQSAEEEGVGEVVSDELATDGGNVLDNRIMNSLAVLVSGAGSSEVNGCYLLKGRNGNAWEFELINSITGRTFEMFKVDEESGWWNIQERVGNSSPNPPHYGVNGDNDAILPPADGWGSKEYSGSWLGKDPMPIVQLTSSSRTACKRQEANKSLLVLMNIKIQDKENIAKEIERIREDCFSVCKFYSTCQWMINVVTTEAALMKAFEEVASNLPSNISISTSIFIGTFNKFVFIERFVDQMMDYDLVLIKDNDQRLTSFSWSTFIEKRSNAVISGPLRSSSRNGEKRQWFRFHEASNWSDWGWSTYMFDNAIPIEVPYLEQYFVLMDAKFANFFFNIALRPKLLSKSNDWGMDSSWCAAAKSWDSSRPGCYLVPVASYHEDTRQINQDEKFGNEGFEVIRTYNADPIMGRWRKASVEWRDIIGGKDLDEIENDCRDLLGLDVTDSFDLQACATRASNGVTSGTTEDGYLTLTLIMNEINKRATRQSDEDAQMLKKAKNSLMEHLGDSFYLQEYATKAGDALLESKGTKEHFHLHHQRRTILIAVSALLVLTICTLQKLGPQLQTQNGLGFTRFLASLHIVAGHLVCMPGSMPDHWRFTAFTFGFTWVPFFFMMSGFLLSYGRFNSGDPDKLPSVFKFVRSRMLSIYPLHLAGIFIELAMDLTSKGIESVRPTKFILSFFLLQAWFPTHVEHVFQIQCWFLSCIVPYWFLHNTMYRWVKKMSKQQLILLLASCWLVPMVLLFCIAIGLDDQHWNWKHHWQGRNTWTDIAVIMLKFHPMCHLHTYLFGVAASCWYVKFYPEMVKTECRWSIIFKYGVSIGYGCILLLSMSSKWIQVPSQELSLRLGFMAPFHGLILIGMLIKVDPLSRLFSFGLLPLLGNLSFPQYIFQFICLRVWGAEASIGYWIFLATTAFVAYYCVQRPINLCVKGRS